MVLFLWQQWHVNPDIGPKFVLKAPIPRLIRLELALERGGARQKYRSRNER